MDIRNPNESEQSIPGLPLSILVLPHDEDHALNSDEPKDKPLAGFEVMPPSAPPALVPCRASILVAIVATMTAGRHRQTERVAGRLGRVNQGRRSQGGRRERRRAEHAGR